MELPNYGGGGDGGDWQWVNFFYNAIHLLLNSYKLPFFILNANSSTYCAPPPLIQYLF